MILKVQGQSFNTTFYLLTLGGSDVVLGVKCLETLGPITWNFSKLTMKILYQGKKFPLQELSLQQLSFVKESRAMLSRICWVRGLMLQISQEEVIKGEGKLQEGIQKLLNNFNNVLTNLRGCHPLDPMTIRL